MNYTFELLNDLTTYQRDFLPKPLPRFPNKPEVCLIDPLDKIKPAKKPKQIDLNTLQPFKDNVDVQFGLLHRPKDVVQTNPHDKIIKVEAAEEEDKETKNYLKTKPFQKVILSEIEKEARDTYIKNIYTSDWKESSNFSIKKSWKDCSSGTKKSDMSSTEIDRLIGTTRWPRTFNVPDVPRKLLEMADTWDRSYPVEYVDLNDIFWKNNMNRGLCNLCDPEKMPELVSSEQSKEIQSCIKQDVLRLPYNNPVGFRGFIPKSATGVPLRKKMFTKNDPWLTTLNLMQGFYRDE